MEDTNPISKKNRKMIKKLGKERGKGKEDRNHPKKRPIEITKRYCVVVTFMFVL